GAGENACILHYTHNNAEIKDGDLILIDAGCELDYYASDITRTFPANGKFSAPQRKLYQLVLDANYAAIAQVKAGNHWNQPHEAAVRVLTEGLVKLGLLQGDVDELIEALAFRQFYMHKTGHWLGMDVHDVGEYRIDGEWRILEEGMVMTIEPGLYIAPDDETVDAQWRGIGIRIEDDVVVTKAGCQVLTSKVVKDMDAIEALMAGGGDSMSEVARTDIAIIGAGMVGASLVHLLRPALQQGLSLTLIERQPLRWDGDFASRPPSFDGRATAVSYGSQQILQRLDLWAAMAPRACAIEHIQVSDQGHFGQTQLHADEQKTDALGYIVENAVIGQGLLAGLEQPG